MHLVFVSHTAKYFFFSYTAIYCTIEGCYTIGKSTAKYTAFILLFDMPYPAKLIYKYAMSYKLTFFAVKNLRRIREFFKSFNQENLTTKSIYRKIIIKRKYRQIMLSTAKINLRKKTKQKYC